MCMFHHGVCRTCQRSRRYSIFSNCMASYLFSRHRDRHALAAAGGGCPAPMFHGNHVWFCAGPYIMKKMSVSVLSSPCFMEKTCLFLCGRMAASRTAKRPRTPSPRRCTPRPPRPAAAKSAQGETCFRDVLNHQPSGVRPERPGVRRRRRRQRPALARSSGCGACFAQIWEDGAREEHGPYMEYGTREEYGLYME